MRQSDQSIGKKKPRSISSFLKKTYEILEVQRILTQNSGNYSIVRWAPNGIGFIVVDQERFSKEVLPLYFKHSNYSSFVRQLNMYSFHKIREGNSESYFYHQYFDRHNKSMIAQIKRKPEKKKRKIEESDESPDADDAVSIYKGKKNKSNSKLKAPETTSGSFGSEKKASLENTMQMVGSEQDPLVHQRAMLHTEKNILSMELDDDRLSINEEITERCPRFQTRELIYPSNGMLPFTYPAAQLSNFSLIL